MSFSEIIQNLKNLVLYWLLYLSSVSQLLLPTINFIGGVLTVTVTALTLVKMYKSWNQKQGS